MEAGIQFNGFDNTHRIDVTLDGVLALDRPDLYRAQALHTDITFGPGPVNLVFTGDDSTVTGKEIKGSPARLHRKIRPLPIVSRVLKLLAISRAEGPAYTSLGRRPRLRPGVSAEG